MDPDAHNPEIVETRQPQDPLGRMCRAVQLMSLEV